MLRKIRLIKIVSIALALAAIFVLMSGTAFAQEEEVATSTITLQIDTIWLFIGSFLVFWMQAGFAMVESGFSRSKNAANLMMKNLMDFCMSAIIFYAFGFALMFGADKAGLIGTSNFFLSEIALDASAGYDWAFYLFQLMFAGAAATIVSGAVAERLKFKSYLIYSAVMSALIYPIGGHWLWGGGWLFERGFVDFAGSTIVHACGGFAALAGAWVLGPRIGKFNKDGSSNAIPGHSLTLAALGVFILWMGWFGFNAGSTLSGMNGSLGYIAVTTTTAAAAGALSALLIYWVKAGHPSTEMALNGSLAGLVAITAGTANVSISGAMIIGAVGGLVLVFGLDFVERVLRVDDPVGAVAVHGFNGMWGTIAVGLLAAPAVGEFTGMGPVTGLFYGGGFAQLGTQLLGTFAVSAWSFATMAALFYLMKVTIGIRVPEKEEIEGLDISEHFTTSYPEFGPTAVGTDALAAAGD
jgi:Amt family ammonium transporter